MSAQRPTALLACVAIATALAITTETAGAAGQADRARCDHAPHADHLFDVGCLAPNGGAARADFNGDGKADLASGVPGDHFGAALTWGDYNGDGRADLAVGVPGEDFTNGRADQGRVNIVDGRDGGLTTGASAGVLTQDLLGEDAETGDGFGSALY